MGHNSRVAYAPAGTAAFPLKPSINMMLEVKAPGIIIEFDETLSRALVVALKKPYLVKSCMLLPSHSP